MSGLKNEFRKLEEDIIRRMEEFGSIETEAMDYSDDVKKLEVKTGEKNLEKDSVSDLCENKLPRVIKKGVSDGNEAIETVVKEKRQ